MYTQRIFTRKTKLSQSIVNNNNEVILNSTPTSSQILDLKQIENVVLQGGGVKGLAYLGCFYVIDEANLSFLQLKNIKRVCGASAGAITALILSLQDDFNIIKDTVSNLKMNELLDEGKETGLISKREAILKLVEIFLSNDCPNLLEAIIYIAYHILKAELSTYLRFKMSEWMGYSYDLLEMPIEKIQFELTKQSSLLKDFFKYLLDACNLVTDKINFLMETTWDKAVSIIIAAIDNARQTKFKKTEEFFIQHIGGVGVPRPESLKIIESWSLALKQIFGNIIGGEKETGIFEGKEIINWLEQELAKVGLPADVTFKELKEHSKFKDLYIVALNLTRGQSEIFSFEHTPNVFVIDALRVSMSIPFFFKTYLVREKECKSGNIKIKKRKDLYTDGGVLDNYPIWVFDNIKYIPESTLPLSVRHALSDDMVMQNPHTIGFRLVDESKKLVYESGKFPEGKNKSDANSWEFLNALAKTVLFHKQESDHYHRGESSRTVYIDYGEVSTVDFNLSREKRRYLLESGCSGMIQFLKSKKYEIDHEIICIKMVKELGLEIMSNDLVLPMLFTDGLDEQKEIKRLEQLVEESTIKVKTQEREIEKVNQKLTSKEQENNTLQEKIKNLEIQIEEKEELIKRPLSQDAIAGIFSIFLLKATPMSELWKTTSVVLFPILLQLLSLYEEPNNFRANHIKGRNLYKEKRPHFQSVKSFQFFTVKVDELIDTVPKDIYKTVPTTGTRSVPTGCRRSPYREESYQTSSRVKDNTATLAQETTLRTSIYSLFKNAKEQCYSILPMDILAVTTWMDVLKLLNDESELLKLFTDTPDDSSDPIVIKNIRDNIPDDKINLVREKLFMRKAIILSLEANEEYIQNLKWSDLGIVI